MSQQRTLFAFLLCTAALLTAQEKQSITVQSNLQIPAAVEFCSELPEIWELQAQPHPNEITGEQPLVICLRTNSSESVFTVEPIGTSSNLTCEEQELKTFYKCCHRGNSDKLCFSIEPFTDHHFSYPARR